MKHISNCPQRSSSGTPPLGQVSSWDVDPRSVTRNTHSATKTQLALDVFSWQLQSQSSSAEICVYCRPRENTTCRSISAEFHVSENTTCRQCPPKTEKINVSEIITFTLNFMFLCIFSFEKLLLVFLCHICESFLKKIQYVHCFPNGKVCVSVFFTFIILNLFLLVCFSFFVWTWQRKMFFFVFGVLNVGGVVAQEETKSTVTSAKLTNWVRRPQLGCLERWPSPSDSKERFLVRAIKKRKAKASLQRILHCYLWNVDASSPRCLPSQPSP